MNMHTPAPWVDAGDSNRTIRHAGTWTMLAIVNGRNGTDEVASANARLIAASPDLLAACEAIVHAADHAPPVNLIAVLSAAIEATRSAVAKAKGTA